MQCIQVKALVTHLARFCQLFCLLKSSKSTFSQIPLQLYGFVDILNRNHSQIPQLQTCAFSFCLNDLKHI